ncbi:hypothetical protein [Kribbella sp. NPDC051620]|uniref:hypothetical protein n=1 Tax=Kribbella sp. NPDC051620 TaxID=3364120 RepID=UPI00378D0E26
MDQSLISEWSGRIVMLGEYSRWLAQHDSAGQAIYGVALMSAEVPVDDRFYLSADVGCS